MLRATKSLAATLGAPGGADWIGLDAPDDAAVVTLPNAPPGTPALVLTTDFFTPIVDDPEVFGRIAAVNAMSDVWAMGGTPLFALALAAFPRKLPMEMLARILAGGANAAAAEGVAVVGGHTIDDEEPKYGLCVVGTVDPGRAWRKQGLRDGDALVLTKALGTGIVSTAIKRDEVRPGDVAHEAAVASMCTPNRRAAEHARAFDVHAATDVTGYGLLGHLSEMLREASVDVMLDAASVPLLPEARTLTERGFVPGGSAANLAFVQALVDFDEGVAPPLRTLLADAQTSGGLLVSLPEPEAHELVARLGAPAACVGRVVGGSGRIRVR